MVGGFEAGDEVERAGEDVECDEGDDVEHVAVAEAEGAEGIDVGHGDGGRFLMGALAERDDRGDGGVVGGAGASERYLGAVEAGSAGGVGVGLEAQRAPEMVLDGERDPLADRTRQLRALHGSGQVEVAGQHGRGTGHGRHHRADPPVAGFELGEPFGRHPDRCR